MRRDRSGPPRRKGGTRARSPPATPPRIRGSLPHHAQRHAREGRGAGLHGGSVGSAPGTLLLPKKGRTRNCAAGLCPSVRPTGSANPSPSTVAVKGSGTSEAQHTGKRTTGHRRMRGGEGWGGEGRTKAGDRQDVDWGSAEERNEGSQHSTVVHCAADKLFPCPTAARSRRKVPHATAKRGRERVEVGVRNSPRHRKSLPEQHHDAGFVRPSSLCYIALVLLGQVMLREVPSRSSRGHRRCRGARARHGSSEAVHSM